MAPKSTPNGSAKAPAEQVSSLPPVVGINFGNSYASIAVFTKEGLAESIANEDGERQIACAISFFGEEIYIGNQATQQLVKNSKNTITGFRNLLGKTFSEIPQSELSTKSATVIQHPDRLDEPAYKVQVLQPAPSPLPQSTQTSTYTTPAASHAATPRSEPTPAERILTVSEVTAMFLASLVESASDFLGTKVRGAVLTVPPFFTPAQKDALEQAAEAAGVHVLQLLDEAGAAVATSTSPLWTASSPNLHSDRTQLIVDVGTSALSLTLLSLRAGLAFVLASSSSPSIGGFQIDDKLIKFFATDFTKKTKVPLSVCPSTDVTDQRAEARLRLAIEHTKRTISASSGAATCSVESLKDGIDYTGSINRMRFDTVVRPVYAAVSTAVTALLSSAAVDPHDVDEIVYVGGSASLPGLDEHLVLAAGFREDVETPFARGTVVGGGVGDPTTVLARGCAVQGALVWGIREDEEDGELRKAYEKGGEQRNEVRATTKTVGVLFPGAGDEELGGTWVPIVHKETALPARRTVRLDAELTEQSKRVAVEVWEVSEGIRIEKSFPPKIERDDDDEEEEEEEEEEIETKHRTIKKETYLGSIAIDALLGIQTKGKGKEAGKWSTTVEVQVVVDVDGSLRAKLREFGGKEGGGAKGELKVPAPGS
ncbi:Heat shock protein 70 C57A7.12 [Hypsizygus marmoreus]|uniref:Heat shock protein 70 C57A7.12 n=1 Tax=Hypsizygus marmoreus TaxID=39966 RepID=A0A369KH52_HYPMA|nr:Heat shock protein 70 C57A7.12 [Hypsizygus marmoreus]